MKIFGKEMTIDVKKERFFGRLGYPASYDPPFHVEELIDWTKDWYAQNGKAWVGVVELEVMIEGDQLFLNNLHIESTKLLKRYQKRHVKKAILVASTAGGEADKKCKELWAEDITDQSFFLDAYAAAYAETLVANAAEIITEWAEEKGLKTLSRFSPGYPGWDLKEQQKLWQLANNQLDSFPIQINESSILDPQKSQLSVIGLYE